MGCNNSFPIVSYPSLLSQETPTNELSVQGTPEGDTDPSTPPAPPTPPHPATPGDGFPNNDSGFGEGRSPRLGQRGFGKGGTGLIMQWACPIASSGLGRDLEELGSPSSLEGGSRTEGPGRSSGRQDLVEVARGREVAEVGGAGPCRRVGLKPARLVCL